MRWLRQERGFTLIELVVVMAITGLLMAGIIIGKGLLFQNSAFTGAMDDAQNAFRQIQNEANQALSINAANTGQSAEVIFGRLATLTQNSSTVQTWTLVGAEDNTGTVVSLAACNELDQTLPDGVVYEPNPGATNTTKSIIFTRSTDPTATDGQVFVAPDGANAGTAPPDDASAGPSASAGTVALCPTVAGDVTTPLPSDPAPAGGLVPQCNLALGESDTRNGTTNPADYCSNYIPARPTLTITDAEKATATGTASAAGTLTTASSTLPTVVVTLPSPSPEPSQTIHLWDNGVEVASFANHPTGNSATFSYSLGATAYGTHDLTATWDFGTSEESLHSYAVDVTYPNPVPATTCTLSETTPTTYKCGLVGSYYRGSTYGLSGTTQATAQTVAIDGAGAGLNIGEKLSSSASAYGNFLPTLETRTGQQIAQTASVTWTGQIYLAPGSQTICLQSDNTNSTFTIGSASDSGNPTPTAGGAGCGSFSGGTLGAWDNITIKYTHKSASGEGSASVRLVTPTTTTTTHTTTTPESATLCASYVWGGFLGIPTCEYSTDSSAINTCYTGTAPAGVFPPQLPGGGPWIDCIVKNFVASTSTTTTTTSTTLTDVDGSRLRYSDSPAVKTSGPPGNSAGLTASYYGEWPGGNTCPSGADATETVTGIGNSSTPATWTASSLPPSYSTYESYHTYLEGKTYSAAQTEACFSGYLQIPQTGYYQFCIDADEDGEFYWGDTGESAYFPNGDYSTPSCSANISTTAGQHPVVIWDQNGTDREGAGLEVTVQQFNSSGTALDAATQIPDSWYTTTDTYVAAGSPQTQLPGYQQIVQNIEKTGQRLPATPNPVAQAKSNGVLQKIAQAITPPAAYAAAGDSPNCNLYILDPYNYLNTCSAFDATNATSIILGVPGDTHTGQLHFDSSTGTISWSDN